MGSIPGLGGSPVEGHGNHSSILALKNPMDRGSWEGVGEVQQSIELQSHIQLKWFSMQACVQLLSIPLWKAGEVVQSLSHVWLFVPSWTAAHQASLSSTISWSLLKFMSIDSVMLSNHLIICCPLLLLPWIFPSIRIFSKELAHHIRWPKCWSLHFSISTSNEYSELLSFRIDWFDHFTVQRTL